MHAIHRLGLFALTTAVCSILASHQAEACTGIRLQAKDGSVVYARTLEFDMDLASNPIIIPRHFKLHGTTPSGKSGLSWESRYGATGLNGLGMMVIVDGVNEKGLAAGIFFFPGYAQYQSGTSADDASTLAPWELVTWLLTSFATVDEVRALPEVHVRNAVLEGNSYPLHYVVHDADGHSLVIEYLDGKLSAHDNPIGVITNSPDFEWHTKNLNNYVNLSPTNAAPETINGVTLRQFGQGSGLVGIPGDYTPPSRFVRAAVLAHSALPGDDGPATVDQAFHVLDGFDIPRGAVRGVDNGQPSFDHTQWTSASDTRNRVFYFHTHNNRRVRHVDLREADLEATRILLIPRRDQEPSANLTPGGKG